MINTSLQIIVSRLFMLTSQDHFNNLVLPELLLVTNHKFKNLLVNIRDAFKKKNIIIDYSINNYNFSNNLKLTLIIRKSCTLGKENVFLNCFVNNLQIYKQDESEYNINLLHVDEIKYKSKKFEHYVFKIAKILDYIDTISDDYVYSKYHDFLIIF